MTLRLDLNLLVALDALLTERSVTRAADRRGVGQPAMSASLARLRRHFDDRLLVREGRGLALTPFAETLIEPVGTAVRAVEHALDRSRDFDPRHDRRTFTVVASDYVLVTILRPLMAALADEAPGIQISVIPVSPDYDSLLRQERVDMVIVPSEVIPRGFRHPGRHLFTDRYVLAVDRDNREIGNRVTAEQIASLRYASYLSDPPAQIDRMLDSHGIRRRVVASTQSFVSTPFLMRGTGLACLIQNRLAHEVADAAHIRILEIPLELNPIHEWAYWHSRYDGDPGHRWFRNRLFVLESH